ncbi:hypothetical protein CXB51_022273 [Gossypium anomalum]|uniref:Uncharacterized protein n=1 Tax=Gossypium anomalum TaxID=47600 RepID=A0A8J5Y6X7_9ROSI|nr:hypothetical protein CXB51_022273 [Gossypium anomalum]
MFLSNLCVYCAVLPDFAEVSSFIGSVFDPGTSGYYRAPELIFGATKYTTAIGICSRYVQPLFAGESGVDQFRQYVREDDMEGMMRDTFNMRSEGFQSFPPNYVASDDYNIGGNTFIETRRSVPDEQPNEEAAKFYTLLGWTGNSLTMLLELLREMFPFAKIPQSCKDMKKVIKDLGLGYNKIHSCPNDCMLYWGDRRNQQSCHVCGKSRWMNRDAKDVNEDEYGPQSRRKPNKILRYFPLIPRLQRLFMSSKIVEFMTWHHDQRTDDGLLRHPADSLAWKSFDNKFPSFASDPRSVRLGLASHGFNPFKIMSTSYSTWPVVLVPYNLPPWLCMKQSSLILSMIIPGEKGPGNDIDIYLQPLIEELKTIMGGCCETYDVLRKENFYLRAALLWTINDFPAYANLSGWSTRGRYACLCCATQTCSQWLYNGKKFCYGASLMTIEDESDDESDEEDDPNEADLWKKRSIFFKLPYWEHHILRHNLDVMHIEKNVCENII